MFAKPEWITWGRDAADHTIPVPCLGEKSPYGFCALSEFLSLAKILWSETCSRNLSESLKIERHPIVPFPSSCKVNKTSQWFLLYFAICLVPVNNFQKKYAWETRKNHSRSRSRRSPQPHPSSGGAEPPIMVSRVLREFLSFEKKFHMKCVNSKEPHSSSEHFFPKLKNWQNHYGGLFTPQLGWWWADRLSLDLKSFIRVLQTFFSSKFFSETQKFGKYAKNQKGVSSPTEETGMGWLAGSRSQIVW